MIETRQECSHLLYWRNLSHAPKAGERIWCDVCKDMRVVESRTGDLYAKCHDCRWRKTLQDPFRLRDRVAEHVSEYLHLVTVWNHDRTQQFNVRTGHAADQLVSDPAPTRQKSQNRSRMAPSRGTDTLF